jgi:hypothetical protein
MPTGIKEDYSGHSSSLGERTQQPTQRRQRSGTAGAGMTRAQKKKLEAAQQRIIPGEFFYKSFRKQMGEKTGLVTWTHRKEMRKIHVDQIRYSKSYVTLDVDAHKKNVERTRQIWFQPERDARVKFLADRKIAGENDDLVRRIKKRLSEDTPITLAAKPDWRKRHEHFKVVRKKLQLIAAEEKIRFRNRDNRELLNSIENATPHYDPNEWEEAFQRHVRLKKAMRKVDDPEKKKKTKAEKEKELLAKPERLKTKSEALLGELYLHAMSPKFVNTYCDQVKKEEMEDFGGSGSVVGTTRSTTSKKQKMNEMMMPPLVSPVPSRKDLGDWGSSLLFSRDGRSSGVVSGVVFVLRNDGEETWDDAEQAKLLVMMPQKMSLGGKDVLVGVYRCNDSVELALRIVLEDLLTFVQRSVYLTYDAMHRMTKRYPQLLDDTYSSVRAGKEGKRDKGSRMKSLLLLLDLSGAFNREVVRLPPSPDARARTATMGGKRSPANWKRAPGTAGPSSKRRTGGNLDMSLEIERPRTTSGLRVSSNVIRG